MPLNKINLADYLSDVFIETGTHRGDGVRRALEAGFDTVMSSEIDASFLARMPAGLVMHPNVMVSFSDSQKGIALGCLMAIGKSVTFWLDAHPNGELELDDSNVPLWTELMEIAKHILHLGQVTILVDDMRLFSEKDQKRIQAIIKRMRPNVKVSRANGHCENDILVGQM